MRTRQRLHVDRLQEFERLFIMPLLHLNNTLHEIHFIQESGVGVLLQIGLEVTLQQLVPPVETCGQGIVTRLHLRRLSKGRSH